jgi:hypothetical protein
MNNVHFHIFDIIRQILFFLRSVASFIGDGPLPSVLFAATVFYGVGRSVGLHSRWPRRLGLLMLLAVCLDGFMKLEGGGEQIAPYVAIGFRALLAMLIVEGAMLLILNVFTRLWSLLLGFSRSLRDRSARFQRSVRRPVERRPIEPPPALPPPPPPSLKARIVQAKRDYEDACEAIRSAGLDEDELESALTVARQKYTRRLNEEMKR